MTKRIEETIKEVSIRLLSLLKGRFKDNLLSLANFGSVAQGKIRDGSDIDFLIILKEPPESYGKRVKTILPVISDLRKTNEYRKLENIEIYLEPSFILFSKKEIEDHPPLLLDMVEEVIIFYDKENFLRGELKKMKEKMKQLGSLRKKLPDGSWYWVLKPDIKLGEVIKI